ANKLYHLIKVVKSNDVPFEDVRATFGFSEIKLCPAYNNFMTMVDKMNDLVLEVQRLGAALHQRDVVHAKRRLKLRILEKIVQYDIRNCITLQVVNNTVAIAI